LDDILNGAGASQRRRLTRTLDELTVRWATNRLPRACRWLLNTQVLFLRKDREPTCKGFDDYEWLRTLPENDTDAEVAGDEWMQDVAESNVVEEGPEVEPDEPTNATNAVPRPKVRPIPMGEFLRKWVSRGLLRLTSGDMAQVMAAMRQLGNGTSGGTEAMAISHQILHDLWRAEELTQTLARIKVDEKKLLRDFGVDFYTQGCARRFSKAFARCLLEASVYFPGRTARSRARAQGSWC
jgi:hypothetical protein